MDIKRKTGKSFHGLAREIRRQFLGHETSDEPQAPLRVVLYSHDTMGIGHMRRNLLIANQIRRSSPGSSILAIAGAKEANIFAQHAGVDCLTLPSYLKKADGTYTTRNLGISARDVLDVRSRTILAAVQSYRPDLFIVDKVPAGAGGELLPTLDWLSKNTTCRCVLGLRDVLDTPEKVQSDWRDSHANAVIRKHYASIWIYGDPQVYNAVQEYLLPPDIADRVTFTGYLNTESRLHRLSQLPYEINKPYVLCTVGGGQDGRTVSLNFIEAIRQNRRNAVLLTGPYMPEPIKRIIQQKAESIPCLKVVEFAEEGDLLIRHASHVVSMGGYNTVSAILSHRKPAIVIPRVVPRQEQWLRAVRLAELGLIHAVHPDELCPATICTWLEETQAGAPGTLNSLNMKGLDCISDMILTSFPETRSSQCHSGRHVESNGHQE